MSKTRDQLIWNTGALTFVQLLPRLSGLVLVPLVAHTLGSEQLGTYQLAHVIVGYAIPLILFGMAPLAIGAIARRPESRMEVFAQVLGARLGLTILAVIGVLVLLVTMRYPPQVVLVATIIATTLLSTAIQASAEVVFIAQERADLTALLALTGTALYLLLGLGSLFAGAGIVGLAVAYALSMAVRSAVTLGLLTARSGRPRCSLDLRAHRALLVSSLPFFIHGFGAHLINRVDVLVLSAIEPVQVVGWYLAAYLLLDASFYLPVAFGQAIYPRFSRAAAETGLGDLTCRALRLILICTVPVPGLVTALAPDLVGLLFGRDFAPAVQILQVLIWSLPLVAYGVVVGSAVQARGGQVDLMKIQLLGLAGNVAANLLLVPRIGALGAALSTTGTFLVIAMLHSRLNVRYRCNARLTASAPFAAPVLACWLTFGQLQSSLPWPAALAASLGVYAAGVAGVAALGRPDRLISGLADLLSVSGRPLSQRT